MNRAVFLVSILVMTALPACSDSTTPGTSDTGAGPVDSGGVDAASLPDGALPDVGGPVDAGNDAFVATDSAGPIVDGGGTLTACGARTGHTCADTEYCDYDGAPCGTTDGSGVCRARPDRCVPDTTMVCGCDGTTYASACQAAHAGTDVSSTGVCGGTDSFACGDAIACQTSAQYCEVTTGGAPPGHTSYACRALPTTCTTGSGAPTCATCFTGSSTCADGGPGELTVTRLTP